MKLYETINQDNWIKGNMTDRLGRHCLHGFAPTLHVVHQLACAIQTLYPERVSNLNYAHPEAVIITTFNDHPETTLDDVLRACKVADV